MYTSRCQAKAALYLAKRTYKKEEPRLIFWERFLFFALMG